MPPIAPAKPKIVVVPRELTKTEEERQTIVHCTLTEPMAGGFMLIRIWPTTFLIQSDGTRKKMLWFEQIAPFPHWLPVLVPHTFTLIFEGLDRDCSVFDLVEEIPQEGGFEVMGIQRNERDVYRVRL
ncbi:MAG: hypothetical protein K9I85_11595 [Saprospiraceae bacterium]|nr:hypothetical protein [Saprospiraceae bacterium]